MLIDPEFESMSIVFAGAFNPTIFSPDWLRLNGLIGEAEAEALGIGIIHPEITTFGADMFQIEVQTDRFQIMAKAPPFEAIFDLTCRIFGDVLSHTPISALGINRVVHYKVASVEKLHEIGDMLAPKEPWGDWGAQLQKPDKALIPERKRPIVDQALGRAGGMRTVVMEQSVRLEDVDGHIRATVQPSVRFIPGVFIDINDHYQFDQNDVVGTQPAISTLMDHWRPSRDRSELIFNQIMSL